MASPDVIDEIYEFGKGAINSISKACIAFEQGIVKQVYAPQKRRKRNKIIQEFDQDVSVIAQDAKSDIKEIEKSLEIVIKGKFADAVKKSIKEESKQYDKLI